MPESHGKTRRFTPPDDRTSREHGAVVKDWGGKLPVAIIYPNSYFVGMSNLGLHTIYRLLNGYPDVVCERVFREDKPPLSVESGRPLTDFAVLAFTLSYELDYFNVIRMLKAAGLPLHAAERNETHPLVIAGGPCVTANPMPLSPFFDCLCIGEAEAILPPLLPLLNEGIGGSRTDLLKSLAALPGMYVPSQYSGKPVARQWAKDLDRFTVASAVLTAETELGDMYLVEVERGCGWGCRFCLVCNTFSPMRFHSVEKIVSEAREGLPLRRRIGLVGPAVLDHPHIGEILERLRGLGAELSVSSMRMGSLTPELLSKLVEGGLGNIAVAPEAGSERLRRVIKKGVTEAQVLDAVAMAAGKGMRQLKLYFMIGLPTETENDIKEIIELVIKARSVLEERHSGTRLTVNISPFVPKAGTPFQWLPMAPVAALDRRIELIIRELAPKGIRPKCESPAWAEVQAVLARGDAAVGEVLACMSDLSLPAWRRAVKESGLDVDFYAHQEWDTSAELPWAVVEVGTRMEKLKSELEDALVQSQG